jgi:hypothetical protein
MFLSQAAPDALARSKTVRSCACELGVAFAGACNINQREAKKVKPEINRKPTAVTDENLRARVEALQRGVPQFRAYWEFVGRELAKFNEAVRADRR